MVSLKKEHPSRLLKDPTFFTRHGAAILRRILARPYSRYLNSTEVGLWYLNVIKPSNVADLS
jgi:hypothetical protein